MKLQVVKYFKNWRENSNSSLTGILEFFSPRGQWLRREIPLVGPIGLQFPEGVRNFGVGTATQGGWEVVFSHPGGVGRSTVLLRPRQES